MTFLTTGYYSEGGQGWRLCNQAIVLANEIDVALPDLICGGTKGDARHALQGASSDHNPFVTDPSTGMGIVRAMDISGPYDQLMDLRSLLYNLAKAGRKSLSPFGYLKGPDSQGCEWPIGSGWKYNPGDEGHLHISWTQVDGRNPVVGSSGYVAAIDSLEPYGIAKTGNLGGVATGTPSAPDAPVVKEYDEMPKVIRATNSGGGVVEGSMYFDTGLTCEYIGRDVDNVKFPQELKYRALALQALWGPAVAMPGGDVSRHIQEAKNAQARLKS